MDNNIISGLQQGQIVRLVLKIKLPYEENERQNFLNGIQIRPDWKLDSLLHTERIIIDHSLQIAENGAINIYRPEINHNNFRLYSFLYLESDSEMKLSMQLTIYFYDTELSIIKYLIKTFLVILKQFFSYSFK